MPYQAFADNAPVDLSSYYQATQPVAQAPEAPVQATTQAAPIQAGAPLSDLIAKLADVGITDIRQLKGLSDEELYGLASATGQGAPQGALRGEAAATWNMEHLLAALKAAAAAGAPEVTFTNSAGVAERFATNPESIANLERNLASSRGPAAPAEGAQVTNPQFDVLGNANPNYNPNLSPYGMTAIQDKLIAAGDQQYASAGSTAPGPAYTGFENTVGLAGSNMADVAAQNAVARRVQAIPALQGYIANLSQIKQPTSAQQAELATYKQRLTDYQAGAAALAQPTPAYVPSVPVAPTVTQPTGPTRAQLADQYYTLGAVPNRTAEQNAQLATIRTQLASMT